jgi:hypothetical protein
MTPHRWLRLSFINLLLVATLGVLLRYKIAYSLPFIDQKNILHSHSHFAFTGWVTHTLLLLMVLYLQQMQQTNAFKKYNFLLLLNLFCGYGMLVSFILQGYAFFSISFSTLSIFTAFAFAYLYWKDLGKIPHQGITMHWFKAALIFNILSSFGAFSLAGVMAFKLVNQAIYLSSVYYFLHFQYNGWFFFACMGLFFYLARIPEAQNTKRIFWLLAIACIPAYFLSVLWIAIHPLLYWMVVLASLLQTAGWILFIKLLYANKTNLKNNLPTNSQWLLLLSVIACSIKITLQQFSVIPFLSTLAFGFRPIIIGYLHLVLLGVITLFLLGFIIAAKMIQADRNSIRGIYIFVAGIFINELLLMIQGFGAISGTLIPYINEMLLLAAGVLFAGMLTINLSLKKALLPGNQRI